MAHEFAEVVYSLKALLVCRWNMVSSAFEGGVATLDSDQMLSVEPQSDTDQLRDSGRISRALAVATHADLTLNNGGIDFSALAVLTGSSTATSSTTPNRRRRMKYTAGGPGLPYFGVIGEGFTDDGGLVIVGLKICKLNVFPKIELDGTENKFVISECEGIAIPDANGDLIWTQAQETEGDYTRPTDATTFGAFFF